MVKATGTIKSLAQDVVRQGGLVSAHKVKTSLYHVKNKKLVTKALSALVSEGVLIKQKGSFCMSDHAMAGLSTDDRDRAIAARENTFANRASAEQIKLATRARMDTKYAKATADARRPIHALARGRGGKWTTNDSAFEGGWTTDRIM